MGISWRRAWFELEKPMVEDFMTNISQVPLDSNKLDSWLWNEPPSYSFSVKSAYSKLACHGYGSISGPLTYLWNLKVMPST